jgi:hypothetical protein
LPKNFPDEYHPYPRNKPKNPVETDGLSKTERILIFPFTQPRPEQIEKAELFVE